MSEDTKVCPYCAETIKAAAIVCRYCGRNLGPESTKQKINREPVKLKQGPKQEVVTQADKKNPIIGFVGLAILALGACFCFTSQAAGSSEILICGSIITVLGAGILAYALLTGNIKFFG